jgi:hypothetical protein
VPAGRQAQIALMTTAQQQRDGTDEAAVFAWRFEALMEAGYLPDQAQILAASKEVEVRFAERLLTQGCPRATAARILL